MRKVSGERAVALSLAFAVAAAAGMVDQGCVGDEPSATALSDSGADGAASDAPSDGNSACGDTTSDNANCGSCGHVCGDAGACFNSVCGGKNWIKVAASSHACALRGDGTLWCWGSNNAGELGVDPSTTTCNGGNPCSDHPIEVPGLTDVVDFDTGKYHTCAVKRDGSAWCWGLNQSEQLGHDKTNDIGDGGNGTYSPTPTQVVSPLPPVATIATGVSMSCASTSSGGALWCWGTQTNNDLEQAALGGPDSFTPLPAITLTSGVQAIAASRNQALYCALKTDQTIWCWGYAAPGEYERGSAIVTEGPATAVIFPDAGIATGFRSLTVGDNSANAIMADGTMWPWGINKFDIYASDASPAPYVGPSAALSLVSMSGTHETPCGSRNNGTVACWGVSTFGSVGNGAVGDAGGSPCLGYAAATCEVTPFILPSLLATQVATGVNTAYAIREDGAIVAWGANEQGQLGHPTGSGGDIACPTVGNCGAVPAVISFP